MATGTATEGATPKNTNRLGLTLTDYKGLSSTLCAGCGHDAITSRITRALYEFDIDPYRIVKLSGIGCSSKTPAYFSSKSAGFNAVHGRMPSIATGVVLANKNLIAIGVSGDGDTASIGIGQFVHMVRRNVPTVYIIENNGVYGLTKGQFSATADVGSTQKSGTANNIQPIDCCTLAIELGCGYVARSFAGDPRQLIPLLKGALAHRGTAVIDVISPCVTFNNHDGSTKSYKYGKEHDVLLHEVGFIPHYEPLPEVDYEPGTTKAVELPDGSHLIFKKLGLDYDPTDKLKAVETIKKADKEGQLLTGLIYVEPSKPDLITLLNMTDEPLATISQDKVVPPQSVLNEIMQGLM
ncbi:MAG: 2-oxoglutarate ferredoxin oxidoreductase subunit beta [Planctomycetes bacterium RBG_16_43_13]|nr:MAG: 2-oxoglutarate ferredoxin oxidoreductase subunit beta [Planctomycetes bacterium RBG_16_43_13]